MLSGLRKGVGAVLLLLALAFGLGRPRDPSLFPARAGGATVEVFVVDNGYHANVVVPTALLRVHAGPSAAAAATLAFAPYTAIGWGDARFYVEHGMSGARALDALRALFAPNNPSVVLLEPLRDRPDRLWSTGVTRVRLSRPGFEALLDRADRSFRLKDGAPLAGPEGENGGRFYRSIEHFSLLHLCNHWAGGLLAAAGVPVRPLLGTVGAGLTLDLRLSGAGVDTGAPRR